MKTTEIPSREDQVELALQARNGDGEARNRLIEVNLGLIYKIAIQCSSGLRSISVDDLVSVGVVKFVEAVGRLDRKKIRSWKAYVFNAVRWGMVDEAKQDGPIRLPRRAAKNANTKSDAKRARRVRYLNGDANKLVSNRTKVTMEPLQRAINTLPERERLVITCRLQGDYQKEIGQRLGVSQARISSIERRARRMILNNLLDDPVEAI